MGINRHYIMVTSAFCCLLVAETDADTGPVNYLKIVRNSKMFVDKTLFIQEFLDDDPHDPMVKIITAPTQFGKSTLIDMLKTFLAIPLDEHGVKMYPNEAKESNIFCRNKFKICRNKKFLKKHMQQYPVLHIDYHLDGVIDSFDSLTDHLRNVLLATFKQYSYLSRNYTLFNMVEDQHLYTLHFFEPGIDILQSRDIEISFLWLTQLLFKHYGRKVIVLLDEYDVFCREMLLGNVKDAYKIVKHVNNIHKFLFEHNNYIEKALLTGTLRARGIGVPPTCSHIYDYPWLFDHRFSGYLGFTREDVSNLMKMNEKRTKLRKNLANTIEDNYSGYTTREQNRTLFNPLSVVKYFKYGMDPDSYWHLKKKFFDVLINIVFRSDFCIYSFRQLIDGGLVLGDISRSLDRKDIIYIIQNNITRQSEFERLVVVLYDLGMLSPIYEKPVPGHYLSHLKIPNFEVRKEFCKLLAKYYIVKYNYSESEVKYFQSTLGMFRINKSNYESYTSFFVGMYNAINSSLHYPQTVDEFHYVLFIIFSAEINNIKRGDGKNHSIIMCNKDDVAVFLEITFNDITPTGTNDTEVSKALIRAANNTLKQVVTRYDPSLKKHKVIQFQYKSVIPKEIIYVGIAYDKDSRNFSTTFYAPNLDKTPSVFHRLTFK